MATTSSLLRSALARRKEQSALEDKVADFNWQSSAKTVDDWNAYVQHLQNRVGQSANDLSQQLTYQTKIRSATRSFTSAEIQREQINILEGNGSLQSKQQAIIDLYGLAVGNQDYDLAQNLRQQFDNINIQLQNQAERGRALASSMAKTQSVTFDEHINKLIYGSASKKGTRDENAEFESIASVRDAFAKYGNEKFNEVMASKFPAPYANQAGYWDVMLGLYQTVADQYLIAYEQLKGTGQEYKYQEAYNKLIGQAADGTTTKFEVAPGLDLTFQEVLDAANAERAGQPIYAPKQEEGRTTFEKRITTDYVWGVDTNGNYSIIKVRETVPEDLANFEYNVGKGKMGLDDALKQLGVNFKKESDNMYTLYNIPGSIPGVSGGEGVRVVVSADGTLRAIVGDTEGQQQLYGIRLTESGLVVRPVDKPKAEVDPAQVEITKQLIGDENFSGLLNVRNVLENSSRLGGSATPRNVLATGLEQYRATLDAEMAKKQLEAEALRLKAPRVPRISSQTPAIDATLKAPSIADFSKSINDVTGFNKNILNQNIMAPYQFPDKLTMQPKASQPVTPQPEKQSIGNYTRGLTGGSMFGGL